LGKNENQKKRKEGKEKNFEHHINFAKTNRLGGIFKKIKNQNLKSLESYINNYR
jgi:hypothetical protein